VKESGFQLSTRSQLIAGDPSSLSVENGKKGLAALHHMPRLKKRRLKKRLSLTHYTHDCHMANVKDCPLFTSVMCTI